MITLAVWINALAETLVHSLWQGVVVALLLAGLLAICPRSRPERRCRLAMLSLSVLGVCMLVTFWQALPRHHAPPAGATSLQSERGSNNALANDLEPSNTGPAAQSIWPTILVGSWLFGAGFYALRLVGGALGLATLRRQAVGVVDGDILHRFEQVCRRVGIRQRVRLRISDHIDSPLTFGWLKPMVLVPASLLSVIPVAHLEAIFAHELMHVRRSDFLFNLLLSMFRSAMFFHPAVWWMSRIVQTEREMVCDLGAVKSLRSSTSEYAAALLAIDEWRDACRSGSTDRMPLAMSMRAGGGLLARVERLALARQRGSISSPLNVPVIIIFAAASISVFAGWQIAGTATNHGSRGRLIERVLTDPPGAFLDGRNDVGIALQLLKRPGTWELPASEGRLMRPPLVLIVNGIARPFGKNDPPVFGDIPNAWILRHGLNYLEAGVCDHDLDRDGFSAAEEFAADTDPTDASSHPPLIDKLSFIERRQQLYRVEFAARPDSNTFQINRLPSALWTKKTMLLPLGGTSEDGQLELLAWADGKLSLRFRETGQIYSLSKGDRTDMAIDFGIFELTIDGGERYTIRSGDSFVPGSDGGTWTLQSVDESSATLLSNDDQALVKIDASGGTGRDKN